MRVALLSLAAAVVSLGGCGTAGAFGQASMFRECAAGDTGCRRAAPDAPLAVGARLRPTVSVDVPGSVTPVVALSSSRPDVLAIEDGALVARAPGLAAVLIAGADGTVIDFQHVWVAQATAIALERPVPGGAGNEELTAPLQLVAGDQVLLTATLLGGAQRLAGEGELAWQVDGDAVALLADGVAGRKRLVARQPGTATITVASLGITRQLAVEVVR